MPRQVVARAKASPIFRWNHLAKGTEVMMLWGSQLGHTGKAEQGNDLPKRIGTANSDQGHADNCRGGEYEHPGACSGR